MVNQRGKQSREKGKNTDQEIIQRKEDENEEDILKTFGRNNRDNKMRKISQRLEINITSSHSI